LSGSCLEASLPSFNTHDSGDSDRLGNQKSARTYYLQIFSYFFTFCKALFPIGFELLDYQSLPVKRYPTVFSSYFFKVFSNFSPN
jgi:hypothetical protein